MYLLIATNYNYNFFTMALSVDTFQALMSCAALIVSTCLYCMLSPTLFTDVFYLVLFCIYVCKDDVIGKKKRWLILAKL